MSESVFNPLELKGCSAKGFKTCQKDGRKYCVLLQEVLVTEVPVCPKCNKKMYKHGTRKISVVAPPINALPCVFEITFPRFRCSECGEMHIPKIEGIDERRRATDAALLDIICKGLRNTFEDVTHDYLITGVTARNIFEDFMKENKAKLRFKTPVFLGIDEIKIKNLGEITVITDLEHRTLFDMLPKRDAKTLEEYFKNLPDKESVLWVCSDMYRPFEKPIGSALTNARWAIDHFHLVAYANLAVDYVRKIIQGSMTKKERIKTKKGLAYTLKTRLRDLDAEDAEKIRIIRTKPKLAPMAVAFDLKEDFFNIYDENLDSKANAKAAFAAWEASIPVDDIYCKFRELAKTVHNFYDQIFNFWDCPITISNGFTECTNRLIRENNCRGRGYSFEILRGRSLYRKANLEQALAGEQIIGPSISSNEPVFRFENNDYFEFGFEEAVLVSDEGLSEWRKEFDLSDADISNQ